MVVNFIAKKFSFNSLFIQDREGWWDDRQDRRDSDERVGLQAPLLEQDGGAAGQLHFKLSRHTQVKNDYLTEMCSCSEAGSHSRLRDFSINQL